MDRPTEIGLPMFYHSSQAYTTKVCWRKLCDRLITTSTTVPGTR